jgi:hypothetical protein
MNRKIVNVAFALFLITIDVAGFLSSKPYLGWILLAAMAVFCFTVTWSKNSLRKCPELSENDIDFILSANSIQCLVGDLLFHRPGPSWFFPRHSLLPKKKSFTK